MYFDTGCKFSPNYFTIFETGIGPMMTKPEGNDRVGAESQSI